MKKNLDKLAANFNIVNEILVMIKKIFRLFKSPRKNSI